MVMKLMDNVNNLKNIRNYDSSFFLGTKLASPRLTPLLWHGKSVSFQGLIMFWINHYRILRILQTNLPAPVILS